MSVPGFLVVFSDLDGSLLDHHDYSWQPAREAVDKLAQSRAPLILARSKTATEMV
jgi:mannosyl-3-phosphoglycerate phosphatase